MKFTVASFNVNSIRSRKELLLEWLLTNCPDVICLQETKVRDIDFPEDFFKEKGFHAIYKGQKSYNGVAILSPHPITPLNSDLGDVAEPGEARLLAASVKGIPIINTYIPQGQAVNSPKFSYKLSWIKSMRDYFNTNYLSTLPLLWMGDFNVAPEPKDVHDPKRLYGKVGFHPEEHLALQYVKEWGFQDVFRMHEPEAGHFTFWDYRIPKGVERNLGWRIDHIWATESLAKRSTRAWIDMEPRRREKPSDHTLILAEFELSGESI
ncbi:Exodeoxyribonuclease III [Desulforamulus reducens MI-1]|uniref:Exodeoxyribonuclease III n=1 Tax=Desulforamulus reducens (strain ATCC BAA-1160 / DSM 100696 / MI-1) TaxID=349161 RepID=A4J3R1_DESRM|nr:exodeoxyribonuclease III [Desulforamulus reducens]ABO49714.1 Exodeoxyribonuclease III [Desulforamulus reducens MI-1]